MEKISLNLADDDLVIVAQLVREFPLVKRHLLCRAAFRAGLGQFARDKSFAYEHLVQEVQGDTRAGQRDDEHPGGVGT